MAGPNPVSKTLATLQSAYGLAKDIADLEGVHAVKLQFGELLAKIVSAQESALRSQERETALTRRVHALEDRIGEIEAWSTQKERYQLTKLPPGVFVYEIKEAARGEEPPHYVCAKCFEQQKRSFLNSDEATSGTTRLHCPSCEWKETIGHFQKPRTNRGPRGGGPGSWMGA